MLMKRLFLVMLLLSTAVIFTACGSSSDDDPRPSPPPVVEPEPDPELCDDVEPRAGYHIIFLETPNDIACISVPANSVVTGARGLASDDTVWGTTNDIRTAEIAVVRDNITLVPLDGPIKQVKSMADLAAIATDPNGNYVLTDNITVTGTWTPIGIDAASKFTGVFHGAGWTISNVKPDDVQYAGLFGYVDGAYIRHLTVNADNNLVNPVNSEFIGAVAGQADNSFFDNITTTGSVSTDVPNVYIGGLAGSLNRTTVTYARNVARIRASALTTVAGGIAGIADDNSSITKSYSESDISSTVEITAGGIVGDLRSSNVLKSFYNGTISGGANSKIGGIAGVVDAGSDIYTSHAAGSLSGGGTDFIGGIAGDLQGRVEECYAENTIVSLSGTSGGIAGEVGASGLISRSAAVNATVNGGTAGRIAGSDLSASGLDNNTANEVMELNGIALPLLTGAHDDLNGLDASLAEFKTKAPFKKWDFNRDWKQPAASLPVLKWKNLETYTVTLIADEKERVIKVLEDSIVSGRYGFDQPVNSGTVWGTTADILTAKTAVQADNQTLIPVTDQLILVKNETDFSNIRNNMNGKYIIEYDINLDNLTWAPIGTDSNSFNGIIHGAGRKITNITLRDERYTGLFGYINGADFSDLTFVTTKDMDMGTVSGTGFIGVVAGYGVNSKLSNLTVMGEVNADDMTGTNAGLLIGGLAGYLANSTVTEAASMIDIKTPTANNNAELGGITGAAHNNTRIEKSYSEGEITGGQNADAGGITGVLDNSTIAQSYSNMDVMADAASRAGGIAGKTIASIVENCYATGDIDGGDGGGLAGEVIGGAVRLSYARGNVDGDNTAGGIAGNIRRGTLDNAIVSATAAINNDTTPLTGGIWGAQAGRIIGEKGTGGDLSKNVADADMLVGGVPETSTDGASIDGEDKASSSFKSQTLYVDSLGWDFTDIWKFDTALGEYPVLKWQ